MPAPISTQGQGQRDEALGERERDEPRRSPHGAPFEQDAAGADDPVVDAETARSTSTAIAEVVAQT